MNRLKYFLFGAVILVIFSILSGAASAQDVFIFDSQKESAPLNNPHLSRDMSEHDHHGHHHAGHHPMSGHAGHGHHHHGGPPSPPGIMGDHIMAPGDFMVSYLRSDMKMDGYLDGSDDVSVSDVLSKYGSAGQNMTMEMHMLDIMFGVTETWTGGVMLHYMRNDMTHLMADGSSMNMNSEGIGDIRLTAARNLYKKALDNKGGEFGVNLNLGLSLPTGSIDEAHTHAHGSDHAGHNGHGGHHGHSGHMNHGARTSQAAHAGHGGHAPMNPAVDLSQSPFGSPPAGHGHNGHGGDHMMTTRNYMMQLGSGTVDPTIGLTAYRRWDDYNLGAQASYTPRFGRNGNGYRLGDEARFTGWVAKELTDHVSASFRLNGHYRDNIKGADPLAPPNPGYRGGGVRVDALAGVSLYSGETSWGNHTLQAEYGMPIYQNLNGPQMQTEQVFNLSYRIMW